MKRCAFLTMDDLSSYVSDDALAVDELQNHKWEIQLVPWRNPDVDWNYFDLVVIRSPWDYMDAPGLFLNTLETIHASSARLENPLAIVRWNIDKRYLLDLEKKDINIVPTLYGSGLDQEQFAGILDSFGAASFIIKPVISANAKDTFWVSTDHIPSASILSTFRHTDYMAQPFMHHILEEGEYSLFFFNGNYSHCIRKVPKGNDFRVQEEHGGHITAFSPTSHLLECAQRILESLPQPVLYARVDLVKDEKGDYALMELELIEPSLYLRMDSEAPLRFARAIDSIPL